MKLTARQVAQTIDQTLLKPYASYDDLRAHCESAMAYGFKTVAINNAAIPFCHSLLKESSVLCDAAVSFPLGQCTVETKVFETEDAIQKGAGEVDYVVNLTQVKNGRWDYVQDEMRRIVEVCRSHNVVSKVIFENCYLDDQEKRQLCEIALQVCPDFIKTSTGFGSVGATLEDVRLMKSCVGDQIRIKAAGGIRTAEQALAFLEAGASRIGTSCGIAIVNEWKEWEART